MLITYGLDVEGKGESTLRAFAALSHIDFGSIDFEFFDFFIFVERKCHCLQRTKCTSINFNLQFKMTFNRT
jgi:hypothetical protein